MIKKLKLTQIAEILGVSIATVSNAFNRPDQLSAKTREHILAESERLGYHGPSHAARSMRMGASGIIGVIFSGPLSYAFSDPVANQFLEGISEVLVDKSKQLLLLSSDVQSVEQRSAESLPDGLIIYGAIPRKTLELIQRVRKPMVIVDFDPEELHSVTIDDEASAYKIASHAFSNSLSQNLLKIKDNSLKVSVLGLKLIDVPRVCRLTKDDLSLKLQISHNRLAGYVEAGAAHNIALPADSIWHIPTNNHYYAEIAAREALMTLQQPNILLCMSDVIALSALKVAKQLGLRVPEDLQITGFDGIPEASRSEPGLTTINQQSVEKGRVAATLLLNSIKSGSKPQHAELETLLVVRGSCPE
jgi:DNA-binding LacI/PurR family transcriptional regulator